MTKLEQAEQDFKEVERKIAEWLVNNLTPAQTLEFVPMFKLYTETMIAFSQDALLDQLKNELGIKIV
jgi:hypothetical protein